jgi:hypothetical protein
MGFVSSMENWVSSKSFSKQMNVEELLNGSSIDICTNFGMRPGLEETKYGI